MKKILRILVFILGGIFIFSQKVSAICDSVWYSACIWDCVQEPYDPKCMSNCNTEYPDCIWSPPVVDPKPSTPELDCDKKCQPYAVWEAKDACMCRCRGGIVLNTSIPFLGDGGRCIQKDDSLKTTDLIAQAITKILMTIILVWGFGNLIFAWVQFASDNPTGGKKRIINTIIAFAVIWSIWLILRLINPNIFK